MSENETDLEGSGTDSESTDYNSSDSDSSLMPAPYSYEPSGTESESDDSSSGDSEDDRLIMIRQIGTNERPALYNSYIPPGVSVVSAL